MYVCVIQFLSIKKPREDYDKRICCCWKNDSFFCLSTWMHISFSFAVNTKRSIMLIGHLGKINDELI